MSLGLFPSSAAVFSSNSDNKNDQNSKFVGGAVLRALSENFATSNNAGTIAQSTRQHSDPLSLGSVFGTVAEGTAAAAQRPQRNPQRRGVSPLHQQQPYISGTGGAKRKLSNTGSEQKMQQQVGTSSDDDEFWDGVFGLANEPKAKQRRYEERMSTKLSGIQLKDEHGKTQERTNERTTAAATSAQTSWGDQRTQQRKGPIIEEISDWCQLGDEDELPFEDESLLQAAISAPIVEEPEEGTANDHQGKSVGRASADRTGDNSELESSSSADCEAEEQRHIELSPELRNLISSLHNGGDGPLPPIGRPIRTGKELVPFVPPSSAAFLSNASGPTDEWKGEETAEMPRVEEILDDEILPDAAVGTPHVQSDNEDDWPPTPPSIDDMTQEKECDKKLSDDAEREDESAMETD